MVEGNRKTTLRLSNIHCPSCVSTITSLLSSLSISHLSVSLISGAVSYYTASIVDESLVKSLLIQSGFQIIDDSDSIHASTSSQPPTSSKSNEKWWQTRSQRERQREREEANERERRRLHLLVCRACAEEEAVEVNGDKGKAKGREHVLESIVVESPGEGSSSSFREEIVTVLSIAGMTCASCTGSLSAILQEEKRIYESSVTLLPARAVVRHDASLRVDAIVEMIEDAGFEAGVVESRAKKTPPQGGSVGGWYVSKFIIEGMTCSSCVGSLSSILDSALVSGIRSANISLLPPLATIVHDPSIISTQQLREEIEDGGYGAELVTSLAVESEENDQGRRTVRLRVDGMFCEKCVNAINSLLRESALHSFTPLTLTSPYTTIIYTPTPPSGLTLLSLRTSIAALGPFSIYPIRASETLDALARSAQAKEATALAIRVFVTFLFAIPTFVIAIVGMSILTESNAFRQYLEQKVIGSADRGTVILFALATPVQFGIGSIFYSRAFKGVRSVWRRQGPTKWRDRLLRWGSMDSLVALGTTTAFVASFVFMVMDMMTPFVVGSQPSAMSYFDASVLLVLFILLGRMLEGFAKRRTGDAIEALGKMRPVTGMLYIADESAERTLTVEADFLEVGDVLLIQSGSAVPLDSILLPTSSSSNFDESSLTGESLPVLKSPSDTIFAGSTNLGPSAVIVRVTKGSGETMIDGIVEVVRDAMSRKASIERLADTITGYFVPAIVGIALFTFSVWIIRGYSGNLPKEWLDEQGDGASWTLFAVQFAVAVLVVSCPCGIGLAAPTAQMVGTGLSARLGIVPYGGGEAFQNATQIDVVVFDKTGTLTSSLFSVSDHHLSATSPTTLWNILEIAEESSSHPISIGLRNFCRSQLALSPTDISSRACDITLTATSETPGRGLRASLVVNGDTFELLVGNSLYMSENGADYGGMKESEVIDGLIHDWSSEGKSIVLVALSSSSPPAFHVVALFGVEDQLRPESAYVIRELEAQGIAVFVCSGDNEKTTLAVARKLDLDATSVFAGVLPIGKKECIERLQKAGAKRRIDELRRRKSWWSRLFGRKGRREGDRTKVLFVGDGINDLVALTQADVGVSMGTGSSVTLSTSDFCLLSSNLLSLLTLLSLARATFNKIISNFIWACLFNTLLIPIAAGAFFSLGGTRLPPVWASLAMALSSVSVVCNSLLLRWTFSIPRAVREFNVE